MNRLTDSSNMICILEDKGFAVECFVRLMQYENTGLTPPEVQRLQKEVRRQKDLIKKWGEET